jgi:Skp family chaperone for outer membrane proteins
MKKFPLMIAVLLLLAVAPWKACSAGEVKGATSPEAAQQKEQYEKGMEERLKKLGRKLDELNAKAAAMTEQAKIDINRRIAEAKIKQKAASAKLDELRKKSEKKWKKFTSETDAAMDEFEKAYERAKAHFKE